MTTCGMYCTDNTVVTAKKGDLDYEMKGKKQKTEPFLCRNVQHMKQKYVHSVDRTIDPEESPFALFAKRTMTFSLPNEDVEEIFDDNEASAVANKDDASYAKGDDSYDPTDPIIVELKRIGERLKKSPRFDNTPNAKFFDHDDRQWLIQSLHYTELLEERCGCCLKKPCTFVRHWKQLKPTIIKHLQEQSVTNNTLNKERIDQLFWKDWYKHNGWDMCILWHMTGFFPCAALVP